jgi:DNA-binding NarL/FixJ family response regulator
MVAATIEAMLRGDGRFDVRVGPPSALARFVDEDDVTVVVVAASPPALARMLDEFAALPRRVPLLALTTDPRAAWTTKARRAGLRAVLRSDVSSDALRAAVAAVAQDLVVIDLDAAESGRAAAVPTTGADRGALTAREREILEMLAEGLGNRAIASRLGISRFTVKFHVAAILAKLGAASRTEAVTVGVRRGLIAV